MQRDINLHKCIRRLWRSIDVSALSVVKSFDTSPYLIQAFTENRPFTGVGDIGRLFYAPTYRFGTAGVGDFSIPIDFPQELLIDVNNPAIGTAFKYLTVFDPNDPRYGGRPYGETRIKGRININTAPWFVLAQLPWVTLPAPAPPYNLARSIAAYRDKAVVPGLVDHSSRAGLPGFTNIGELMREPNMYGINTYDFNDRDKIFARASNLVTVRSDVFTAYILVRIGLDGPQKRMLAILDRSGVVPNPDYDPITNPFLLRYLGKVKIIAVQPVPDPR
jgi:hypothetical protein